ncbi:uncharacterized protein LOC109823266 [Asparagus officinalis]|uniref:uncharacterized protein LOC109823266 n=1 Tax=Asparagus officinalis TaxID=4686 RepID=UPI00098DEBF5|nr:uncharacterized protein LOC109823266 [Asparagus officinalis]
MALYEALYERLYRSLICWVESEDSLLLGLDLVRETTEKVAIIREYILAAQSRQKSYADQRQRPLEFQVGDYILLNVSPMKGVKQFDRLGKFSLRYIGMFRIIDHVGAISYRLDLPASMSGVHGVFHVSMLKKHLRDEEQHRVVDVLDLELQMDLTRVEIPVHILAREDKKLRNKVIPLVKVQWNRKGAQEATW